ncbi:cingulin-like protein 1 isoform X4 [Notolabrus celidotus]|uniref:cingulin-like protein 1 isoform X4 n=1 Tax=Notolabrus celidotus TaxID=1203425 RepID=UPI00148F455C|nr:cingulin-like protein 1 isoform X4 [Notolabrus celidotus]
MQGKTEQGNNMQAIESSSPKSPLSVHQPVIKDETNEIRKASQKSSAVLTRNSNLRRAGSIKDLISKFSGPEHASAPQSPSSGSQKSPFAEPLGSPKSKMSLTTLSSVGQDKSPVPSICVTPPVRQNSQNRADSAQSGTKTNQITARIDCPLGDGSEKTEAKRKTQTTDSSRDSVADSGMGSESELDTNKHPESPSEDEPTTPKVVTSGQNPKYQLFLNNETKTNGVSFFENNSRPFHSPYSTSMDYNPSHRMSEFKPGLSPATSELNLYSFNSRSTSPVGLPSHNSRPRYSAYDSLMRRRTEMNNPQQQQQQMPQMMNTHYSVRSNTVGSSPNRKDYIEELTKQLDACQKRNQFLEAESVEMDKERNQIRFEMRNLLVNNEDLLRTNTQLNNEMKRLREQMVEIDREKQSIGERFREMEIEVKEAREVMVEANNQEYAFNFLQQSLQTQLKDAEESLEKEQQHTQSLSEKLWRVERQLEELEFDQGTKSKKTSELNSTIERLETELAEAMLVSSQATSELNLQQKLRDDGQLRVEELEESLLEKEQELLRLQTLVNRLQGEVSGKLIDKERTLEEEIQLRERIQLQCKQAERAVEDLQMELHTTNQSKEDVSKQLKQAQEKMIDLETDLEELHDSEQRWAAKHKRAIEQTEQLQLKLIQEKDLNDLLETDKAGMERQLRELRLEVEELQSSRVQEDVISRAETRVKELENSLRTEERNKSVLANSVSKLERKINELSDQMEEEHRIANEQKELMAQRIRSLKRQVNEAEEEASRKEAQYRHTQRELAEERETSGRLQRQMLDQQTKRMESLNIRQTLDSLRLDLSVDDEDEDQPKEEETAGTVTKV